MSVFEIVAMEMIPVHDKILSLTLGASVKRGPAALNDDVKWLRTTMASIQDLMTKVWATSRLLYVVTQS